MHVVSAFPLAHHYRAASGEDTRASLCLTGEPREWYGQILAEEPLIRQGGRISVSRPIFASAAMRILGPSSVGQADFGPKPAAFVRSRNNSGEDPS